MFFSQIFKESELDSKVVVKDFLTTTQHGAFTEKQQVHTDPWYHHSGVKVMLDADLAEIYGYETRKFNEQVKNNIEKFDEDFRFQLTSEEFENLKSKIWTSNCGNSLNFDNFYKKGNLMSKNRISSWGGVRKMPFAFTEQGIYMLMTVF